MNQLTCIGLQIKSKISVAYMRLNNICIAAWVNTDAFIFAKEGGGGAGGGGGGKRSG